MENLDVITIGEAMAMFVATETGDLAEVEHFMKRVAGAELNVFLESHSPDHKSHLPAVHEPEASYCNRWRKRGSIATLWPSTTASLPVSR